MLQGFSIQINYTDTSLSHRFMRYEVAEENLDEAKSKVEEYIRQMYKEENGTAYHKLQEDNDIVGEKGQIVSAGRGKVGRFFTLCMVCQISKNANAPQPRRELIKNNYDFIDQI